MCSAFTGWHRGWSFKAAFLAIAPTFGAAALVVRLSMLVYHIAMVAVLYAISQRKLAAMLMMAPLILAAITFHPGLYNLSALPSTSGLRYLVPALMVLVITVGGASLWARIIGTLLLAVASLWAFEVFVYTLAPWGYVLFLDTVRTRSAWKPGGILIASLAVCVAAHLAFAGFTFFTTGQWIDYKPYLGLLANFRPDRTGFWGGFDRAAFCHVGLGLTAPVPDAVLGLLCRRGAPRQRRLHLQACPGRGLWICDTELLCRLSAVVKPGVSANR